MGDVHRVVARRARARGGNDAIAAFFGATTVYDASFVVLATVIAEFTFSLCPALTSPLAPIQDKIFDITNLNRD